MTPNPPAPQSERLINLEPRWFSCWVFKNGTWQDVEAAGFTFLCPHCRTTRLCCVSEPLARKKMMEAFDKAHPNNGGEIVPAKANYAWTITGDDFNSLSVSPSIDASASGHWHGFITNGEMT